jgi:hypothetical protein
MNLILMRFGNIPVLAEETAHIAARGTHAEDARAGQEMIQGLLLDRINLQSSRRTITKAEEFSVLIDADEAETGLAVADVAVSRAEIAMDAVICFGFPPEGFVEGGGFLENVEIGHGARPNTTIIRACGRLGVAKGTTVLHAQLLRDGADRE